MNPSLRDISVPGVILITEIHAKNMTMILMSGLKVVAGILAVMVINERAFGLFLFIILKSI
jgi:hypothetical protein